LKRRFGFHPLCAFVDDGSDGTGAPMATPLRPTLLALTQKLLHATVPRN
jgi:hypothetical protein